ncbi:MAG: L-tyrosine/L-tryptophan isonitrile synthase family protein, partial [Leptospiraceae bacterium]|nr:L-tyrosine/L-tryptophan isonitrile synthase family protein [Leptospiraceae bacterium]
MNNPALKIDLQNPDKVSRLIFHEVLKYRRISKINDHCTQHNCQRCLQHHFPKILNKVLKNEPILFVLPAFPDKSPNLNKVIGPLPDYAEELALSFLSKMCEKIKKIYSPGAKIIICSDGRVFSDVIGIKDSDVTRYQDKLDKLILEGN